MLTHQPPSAWAKREKKYHDDKKAWDETQAEWTKQKGRMMKEIGELKADNRLVMLSEANATLEADTKSLTAKIQSLEKSLAAVTQEAHTAKEALKKLEATQADTVRENVRPHLPLSRPRHVNMFVKSNFFSNTLTLQVCLWYSESIFLQGLLHRCISSTVMLVAEEHAAGEHCYALHLSILTDRQN